MPNKPGKIPQKRVFKIFVQNPGASTGRHARVPPINAHQKQQREKKYQSRGITSGLFSLLPSSLLPRPSLPWGNLVKGLIAVRGHTCVDLYELKGDLVGADHLSLALALHYRVESDAFSEQEPSSSCAGEALSCGNTGLVHATGNQDLIACKPERARVKFVPDFLPYDRSCCAGAGINIVGATVFGSETTTFNSTMLDSPY